MREIAFLRVFQGFQSREIFNAFLCTFTKKQFRHLYSTTKWVLSFLTSEIPTSSTFLRPKDSHFYKKIFNTSVFLLVFPCLQSNRFYNQKTEITDFLVLKNKKSRSSLKTLTVFLDRSGYARDGFQAVWLRSSSDLYYSRFRFPQVFQHD